MSLPFQYSCFVLLKLETCLQGAFAFEGPNPPSISQICRKLVKMENQHIPKLNARTQQARLEAATHLGQNHSRIIDDILENSGLVRVRSPQKVLLLTNIAEWHFAFVSRHLLSMMSSEPEGQGRRGSLKSESRPFCRCGAVSMEARSGH